MSKAGANSNSEERFADEMRDACRGLVYMSETDAPVEVFIGGCVKGDPVETIVKETSRENDNVIEITVEKFFRRLTDEGFQHTEEAKRRAERFKQLRDLLLKNLKDVRVIRIGNIRIDIYVVGIDTQGRLVGVKTFAVET